MHWLLIVLTWFPARSTYVPPLSQVVKIDSFKSEAECQEAFKRLRLDWHKTSDEIQLAGSCLPIKE